LEKELSGRTAIPEKSGASYLGAIEIAKLINANKQRYFI
jgi:hypothetical protein